MNKALTSLAFIICVASALARPVSGQASLGAFSVQRSTLIEQIKGLKSSNPRMPPTEFAEAANALLEKNGLNYTVLLDAATCEKLRQFKEKQKDPKAPVKLGAELQSVGAEGARLSLPEPHPATACSTCYVELPILEITHKDFVTIIMGRNIKFEMPSNFSSNTAVLLDAKDQKTIFRTWRIPFRSIPIGVSFDENVVFLGFEEPELAELALSVFGEGAFQIVTREEAENGGKGKIVETPGTEAATSPNQMIRFDRWKNSYLVGFRKPCPR